MIAYQTRLYWRIKLYDDIISSNSTDTSTSSSSSISSIISSSSSSVNNGNNNSNKDNNTVDFRTLRILSTLLEKCMSQIVHLNNNMRFF